MGSTKISVMDPKRVKALAKAQKKRDKELKKEKKKRGEKTKDTQVR